MMPSILKRVSSFRSSPPLRTTLGCSFFQRKYHRYLRLFSQSLLLQQPKKINLRSSSFFSSSSSLSFSDDFTRKREIGEIQMVLGPMFSGKTTELFRRIKRYAVAQRQCVVIKYFKDTRYSSKLAVDSAVTHDQLKHHAVSCSTLFDCQKLIDEKKIEVIAIDEGQFFPDVLEFSELMANKGKTVIIAALNGTFQRKPFGQIMDLVPMAESIQHLSAVCMLCYEPANFSLRTSDEKEVEVIGGTEKYLAVCRSCYMKRIEGNKDG